MADKGPILYGNIKYVVDLSQNVNGSGLKGHHLLPVDASVKRTSLW